MTTATELFPPPLPEPLDDVFVVWELPEALPLAELLEPLRRLVPFADE